MYNHNYVMRFNLTHMCVVLFLVFWMCQNSRIFPYESTPQLLFLCFSDENKKNLYYETKPAHRCIIFSFYINENNKYDSLIQYPFRYISFRSFSRLFSFPLILLDSFSVFLLYQKPILRWNILIVLILI